MEKRFLTVEEFQKYLGIGRTKALTLIKSKDFPSVKLGRTYRVDMVAFDEWISKRKEIDTCTTNIKR